MVSLSVSMAACGSRVTSDQLTLLPSGSLLDSNTSPGITEPVTSSGCVMRKPRLIFRMAME